MQIKYRYFLFLLLLPKLGAWSVIYMQTASDGHLQFSDKPGKESQLIRLENINFYSTSESPRDSSSISSSTAGYSKLNLVQPQNQQTFQNQQQIAVQISIQPALQKEDSLEIWLDGVLIQKSKETSLILSELPRGEHRLQVNVVNAQEKILLSSSPVVFFVHYASITH